MKASNANKVVSVLLSVAMCPMMVPSAAFAADDDAASGASSPIEQAQSADQAEASGTSASSSDTVAPQSESADASTGEAAPAATATVNGYSTLEEAVQKATVDAQGVITYEVTGKVNVDSTGWVQVRPTAATNAKVVKFVGKSTDAEICITQGTAILADQGSSALSVEFSDLKLSKLNPTYAGDYGHSTNYFTTWLRNADAASNCVTYTNCEFPNGVCNNQYGKTVFDSCTFSNATSGLYNMWVYGGNVEVKGGSFTGVRGVKVFTEGTATVAPKVAIEGTSFKGVSEKAAIVVSKPAAVTLSNVSATDCAKGLIQKAIEGSSEEVTLNANGTGIGGSFDITANTGSDAAKAEFNLNAGTLTTEVSSDYLADGFTLSNNGDGTYGVAEAVPAAVAEVNGKSYSSLQAAIDAAPRNATVKLLADTYENVTISANAITLDLNGHTLNGGTVKAKPALTIDDTRVTVQDSSEAQTGTIMREDTAENSGVSSHYVIDVQGGSGFLLFKSGTVKNNSGTANGAKGASLVRVGNDSNKKAHPTVTIAGGTFTQDNFIAIKVDFGTLYVKGGVVNSKNSYAIENWLNANIKDNAVINGNVSSWTYAEGSNSNLNISGGTVNGNVESVTYDGAEGKTAKVSITGGTVNGTLSAKKYNSTEINDPTKATIEVTGGTFSTDPSPYLIESSTATQNADGTYGVEKAYLARVGETSYYTMDEAFKAQTTSGEAITLLRDYTTGSTFNSGSIPRVVDLNGHTWTCTGTDANSAAFEINYADASLTVKNGKVVSSQLIGLIPSAMGGTIKYDNSTLTFEGVEASTTATSGIETNGNNTNDTVVLKNSTLNVPNGFGIYFPSSGTLTIDNSTINAKTMGAQVCSGNLNVTAGSAITVSGDPVEKLEGDGAIQDGAAISIVNRTGYKGLGQIAITGGTFTAKGDNAAIKAYTWDSATKQESAFDNSAKTVAVSGGTFSSAVASGLCAENCTPVANADGTYGVASGVAYVAGKGFETLQAALDAAQDGETVTLLADATEDVVINKSITLDLGGKTLTNTNAGKATISVQGGTVTVKNGNVVGGTGYYNIEVTKDSNANLTLTDVTATAGNNGSSMIDNWGTLTITSGTYTGGLNVVKSEEGSTLSITGGTFTLDYAPSSGYTAVILVYGDTTISGGEFVQTATPKWGYPQVVMTGVVEGYTSITRVTGGHFTNKKSGDNIFHGYGKATSDNFEVSGGTFNKSISEGYCADGFIPTKNADGTYGVKKGSYVAQVGSKKYETLADAIRLSAKGKTIVLLTDVEQNTQLTINKDITLDLNGKTIKNTQDIWGDNTNAILSITNGAKVTITGNGTIDAKENDCYTINVVKGDLTIENGTFYGNVSVVQVQEGILSVKGGTFDLHQKWEGSSKYLINCIDDAYADGSASVAISGGTFVGFDPNVSPEGEGTSYLAPGYTSVANADGTYGVEEGKFTVQVTSRTTTSDSPVANVSGGGSDVTYAKGTTVTASAISGYNFVGWFVNDYSGKAYSTDLTCTVNPTSDCTMIAVYEPVSGGKFWLTVTASEFTVNGGAVQDSYLYEQYAIGESVTVNFTGTENFLYWVNASNKVVSTDESYTFTMGSETTLKAVYGKARQNQATVVFVSNSDQIISSKAYTTSDTIQFPVPPIKMGCTFTGWSMTEDQIHAAMANNGGIIEVHALYTEPSIACKVTVVYPEGVDNEDVDAVVGKAIDVTAKDIEGKTFSYWTDNDGNILGYTKTLKLAPSADMTVIAVYDKNTEAEPVISISEVSATKANDSYVVTFMATRAVPEGYGVVEQGILWSRDAACGEDGAATYMQFDGNGKLPSGVNAYIGNNLELNGVTRLDITTKYSNRTFYGRGYMILQSETGELLYIYTDAIASGSYDSLTK